MVERTEAFSTSGWHRVEDPRAVEVLADTGQLKYLRPFLGQALSASQAARKAGVRLDTMLYQMERLRGLGLLVPSDQKSESRRPVKMFRAVAERFLLPFDAIQADSLLELFLQHDGSRRQAFGRGLIHAVAGEQGGWHVRVYRDADGSVNWEAAPDHDPSWRQEDLLRPESPAAWYTNASVRLTQEKAKELQGELVQLYLKYAGMPQHTTGQMRSYTFQLALAELPGHPS